MSETYYHWDDFRKDILFIISQIYSSSWMPELVVGIKRGGLVPAVSLSHHLQLPLYLTSYQLRDGKQKLDLLEVTQELAGKKVLLVDDICDSGETFEKMILEMNSIGITNVKSCSIFFNIRQKFIVDFKAIKIDRDKDNNWIVFPWER